MSKYSQVTRSSRKSRLGPLANTRTSFYTHRRTYTHLSMCAWSENLIYNLNIDAKTLFKCVPKPLDVHYRCHTWYRGRNWNTWNAHTATNMQTHNEKNRPLGLLSSSHIISAWFKLPFRKCQALQFWRKAVRHSLSLKMNYQPWFLIKLSSLFHTFYHITRLWIEIWKFGHPGGAEEEYWLTAVGTWGQF